MDNEVSNITENIYGGCKYRLAHDKYENGKGAKRRNSSRAIVGLVAATVILALAAVVITLYHRSTRTKYEMQGTRSVQTASSDDAVFVYTNH